MEDFTLPQKGLYVALLALLVLMIVFSVMSLKNRGIEGYNQCIQDKCDERGEAFCTKFREVNNCCLGAGGEVAASESGYRCVFN